MIKWLSRIICDSVDGNLLISASGENPLKDQSLAQSKNNKCFFCLCFNYVFLARQLTGGKVGLSGLSLSNHEQAVLYHRQIIFTG